VLYWLLSLFEISIGCFKLALMLAFGIVFWPCLILYYRRQAALDNDVAPEQAPERPTLASLNKRQMRKFLKIVFFKKKKEAIVSLKQEHQACAICLE
jgi:hypothetical protein